MELLLNGYGADLSQADHHGMTPLMFAAAGDHLAAVVMLARRGADVNAQVRGWTRACRPQKQEKILPGVH